MDPGRRDIKFTNSDDYLHSVTFYTDADMDTAVDISGRTYEAQIRRGSNVVLNMTTAVPTGTDGLVTITATDTQTAAITPGDYEWALREVAGSSTSTVLRGKCVVEPEVVL